LRVKFRALYEGSADGGLRIDFALCDAIDDTSIVGRQDSVNWLLALCGRGQKTPICDR
jgi:hypothetical protein